MRGDTKSVARYSKAKKKTNKARGKAQKSFSKSTIKSGIGLAKVGINVAQGDLVGAGLEFILKVCIVYNMYQKRKPSSKQKVEIAIHYPPSQVSP